MPVIAIILVLAVIVAGAFFFTSRDTDKDKNNNIVLESTEPITTPKEETSTPEEATDTSKIDTMEDAVENEIKEVIKTEKPVVETPKPTVIDTSIPEKPPVSTPTPVSQTKTYTAEETYFVSNNKYTIDVTLDVKDGIVTNTDVMYGNKETGYQHPLQERFDGAYKTQVVGKKLDNISLSRVGGASLTSKAFNEAVANIIDQTTQS